MSLSITEGQPRKRFSPLTIIAIMVTIALVLGMAIVAFFSPRASAATDQCVVDTVHHAAQYKYKQFIPGHPETERVEYKYKQTATVYTVEHKQTGLPTSGAADVIAWYGTIGAVDQGGNKWQLPDAVVNAAGVNPFAVAQTGSVDLFFYGYPGHATVPYWITGIESYTSPPGGSLFVTNHNVTLYYTGSGIGSTSSGDAVWTATNPGSPWSSFGSSRTVGNGDAVADKTVFYLPGGGQSDTNTDANWTTETPGAPWVKIDGEEKAAYDEDVYGPCPPVPPVACEPYGNWYTENVAPVQGANGLTYAGPSASAINWLHPVTGNLQGLTGLSYTIAEASGYHAALRIVLDPNADLADGTSGNVIHYASVSIEPYMNGWAPGQTGTFTVTATTVAWSSKIANGNPGSQSQPIPLADMAALMPDNELISLGNHLGSNSIAGQSTTVSAITGCVNESFIPTPPTADGSLLCTEDGPELSTSGTDGTIPVNHYTLIDGVLVDTDEGTPSGTYGFSTIVNKPEGTTFTVQVRTGATLATSEERYTETFTIDCVEDETPSVCVNPTTLPTSTNLNPRGAVLSAGASYVDGGVLLESDGWVDAYVTFPVNFKLSEIRDFFMNITVADPGGTYGYAPIFQTSLGNVHGEDVYSDELWTNSPGILPPTGGGQGGDYSGSLEDAMAYGNPDVTAVTFLFTSATENSAILSEGGYHCLIQPFDYETKPTTPPVPPKPPVTTGLPNTGQEFPAAMVALAALMLAGGITIAVSRRRQANAK